jgi:hypothetical protein
MMPNEPDPCSEEREPYPGFSGHDLIIQPWRGSRRWERDEARDDPDLGGHDLPVWQPRFHRESARRKALFAKAERRLRTIAIVAGYASDVISWPSRDFVTAAGLSVQVSADHEMTWTPRGGYVLREIDEIPF